VTSVTIPLPPAGALTTVPVSTARDQDLTLLGAAYNFGPIRAFGQYVYVKNKRLNQVDKLPNFGVTIPVGAGLIQAAYSQDKTSGSTIAKRTTATVGYVYSLSKRTDLYAFAMSDKYSVNVANISTSAGTANSYVTGIKHRF
jgi:predicted porin